MQQSADQLILTYTDNGNGFDPNKIITGLGHKNVQSRIKSLKGSLINKSEIHKGASYQVSIPT
jgi:signal transduction histidine kinase